jgi:uncharacterized protein
MRLTSRSGLLCQSHLERTLMHELIVLMLQNIVDDPDAVRVNVMEEAMTDKVTYIACVAPDDIGKVLGKDGRIANAIRILISAATKDKQKISFNIMTRERGSASSQQGIRNDEVDFNGKLRPTVLVQKPEQW